MTQHKNPRDLVSGKTYKSARENVQLTQEAAGAKIGVSKETIRLWEAGETKARSKNLRSAARVYGVSMEALNPEVVEADDEAFLAAVDDYLTGSPRGQSTPPEVAEKLRSGEAFRGLGIDVPTWEEIDKIRQIFERRAMSTGAGARPAKARPEARPTTGVHAKDPDEQRDDPNERDPVSRVAISKTARDHTTKPAKGRR